MGFKYINIGTWYFFDANGNPDFTGEVDKISRAVNLCEKYNIKPIINFNGFINNEIDPITNCYLNTKQLDIIKENLSLIFKTFAGRGIIWGSWNEPDGNFWTKGDYYGNDKKLTQSWIDMEKWIVEETKKYDKNALNTVWGLTNVPSDHHKIGVQAKDTGLFDDADSIMFHPYIANWNDDDSNPECLLIYSDVSQTNLPKTANEFGFPIKGWDGDHWQRDLTPTEAAKKLIRQMVIMDYLDFSWFLIYVDANNSYHLLNLDGKSPNLIGSKVSSFIKEMDGYILSEKIETNKQDYNHDLYVFVYQNEDFESKILYWSPKSIGSHEVIIYGKKFDLYFTDEVQFKNINLEPKGNEFFPKIKDDSSLGTRWL